MALYIASWGKAAGKTALCAAIGRWLQGNGRRPGYLKPVTIGNGGTDRDGQFLKEILGLPEPVEALTPLRLSNEESLKSQLAGGALGTRAKQSHGDVAQGKDVVLVEGVSDLARGGYSADGSYQIVEALKASVILVVAYTTDLSWDKIVSSAQRFGPGLLGIVVSRVPGKMAQSVKDEVVSKLAEKRVKFLGLIPEDRRLLGVSVAEIAEQLQVDILCCKEGSGRLVENVMIGALTPDSGEDYFKRKRGKAVVVRGNRPDLQLAALSTDTRCLILTGGATPIPQVLGWAEDKEVPIIVTKQDTLPAVEEVEKAFAQARFRQPEKLDTLGQLLQEHLDFQSVRQGLGLAG